MQAWEEITRGLAIGQAVYFSHEDRLVSGTIDRIDAVFAMCPVTGRAYPNCKVIFCVDDTMHVTNLYANELFSDPRKAYQQLADSLEQRRVEAVKALEIFQRRSA